MCCATHGRCITRQGAFLREDSLSLGTLRGLDTRHCFADGSRAGACLPLASQLFGVALTKNCGLDGSGSNIDLPRADEAVSLKGPKSRA
jgi:hypothetical protein